MGVYKANIQSDGSIYKLKLRVVVRGDLHIKETIGYTWAPTESTSTLKLFLKDADKQKIKSTPIGFNWIIYTRQCQT